jgi:hypothetical protein
MCSVPVRRSWSTAVTLVPSCSNDISSVANRTSRHRVPAPGPGVGSPACPGRSLRTLRDWQQGQISYTFLLVNSGVFLFGYGLGADRREGVPIAIRIARRPDGRLQSDLAKQLDRARGLMPRSRRCMNTSGWLSTMTTHGTLCAAKNTALDRPVSVPPTTIST